MARTAPSTPSLAVTCSWPIVVASHGRVAPAALDPWGDVIDPDDDCTFRVNERGVSLEVPGSLHDLDVEFGKSNAPRIIREVEGDFVAQVKVCGELEPEAPATREGGRPSNGAGLLLWLDADHHLSVERRAERHDAGRIKTVPDTTTNWVGRSAAPAPSLKRATST